jgi:hypothetical protein
LATAASLGGLGLRVAGAVATRAVIVGTVVLGFWPFIAAVARRVVNTASEGRRR